MALCCAIAGPVLSLGCDNVRLFELFNMDFSVLLFMLFKKKKKERESLRKSGLVYVFCSLLYIRNGSDRSLYVKDAVLYCTV